MRPLSDISAAIGKRRYLLAGTGPPQFVEADIWIAESLTSYAATRQRFGQNSLGSEPMNSVYGTISEKISVFPNVGGH